LIAGLTHALNREVSRNICQSVIDMTLVGTYAETSQAWVSIIGSAVIEPAHNLSFSLAERSSNLE